MANTTDTVNLTVGEKTIIIYNNRKADVLAYSDIYNPDDPISGKVFPSLNSIVLKSDGSLWYVSARNELTFKTTLSPCNFTEVVSGSEIIKVITYGNDKYCAYRDERTDPHKLVIDAKLLFYGNNLVEYSLYRTNAAGVEECVSVYLDNTDTFISNRIPMQRVSDQYAAYKWPTNCHSTYQLTEGEPLTMRVYNNLGNVAAEITLFVRNAVWLNDLANYTNPIVALDAKCLQVNGDEFYIYPKQDPSHLNIIPYLIYSDGTQVDVPVDNTKCFMYGLDDYLPSYPGYSQTLVFKYFLNRQEQAIGDANAAFVTCSKKLLVVNNTNQYTVKLSCIPYYSEEEAIWKLKFFAYSDRRDAVYDVTKYSTYTEGMEFDGTYTAWGTMQHLEVNYDLQPVFLTQDPVPGAQTLYVTTWNPKKYERYLIKENASSEFVYGVDGSLTRRPVLHYDEDGLFIPTSIFRSWDAVVESFYLLARPPYDANTETTAPTPTHFTIRNIETGAQMIGTPVPASEFGQLLPLLVQFRPIEDYNSKVVLVEFLQEVSNGYKLLYGVPVDVYESPTGWNDENNNIYEP